MKVLSRVIIFRAILTKNIYEMYPVSSRTRRPLGRRSLSVAKKIIFVDTQGNGTTGSIIKKKIKDLMD